MQPTDAHALLSEVRAEIGEVERAIREHRFLGALERGEVERGRLEALAGEQLTIISSDRRSFAHLASRFPEPPAGDFCRSMAEGEGIALERLWDLAAWLELGPDQLQAYEPRPQAQAYPAFVSWLALNGSRSDVALAFVANLEAWGANCARVGAALRERFDATDAAVAFFEFFAAPPPDLEERALTVVEQGLAAGESATRARRATRLLQAYELAFWDAIAEERRDG
jgi:hypothetical protein